MENPFDIVIYDRNLQRQQAVTDPIRAEFTPRWSPEGTGELVLAVDDPANEFLQAEGARITVRYKGEHLLSGWVEQRQGPVISDGVNTYDIRDDRFLLGATKGWVVPDGHLIPTDLDDPAQAVVSIHSTGTADGTGYYAWGNPASTETAIKQIIAANFARFPAGDLRRKVRFLMDQQRGGNASGAGKLPNVRFDALDEVIQPLLDWANIGIRIWHEPGDSMLSLDVFTPTTWDQQITTQSQVITDGNYKVTGPTATRLIVGGPGEDTARAFYQSVDANTEDALGFGIEEFVDASGATVAFPESLAETYQVAKYFALRPEVDDDSKAAFIAFLAAAAATALTDNATKRGAAITLSDTENFSYGGQLGYHVGDLLTVGVGNDTFTERITEVTLTYASDGFSVTPTVGERTNDSTAQLAKAIQQLALAARKRATRQ